MNNVLRSYAAFVSALCIQSAAADNQIPLYPALNMHGLRYENACAPGEKASMRLEIAKRNLPDARKLQSAVEFVLCASLNNRNAKRMYRLLDTVVSTSDEGTGQDTLVDKLPKAKVDFADVMAEGNAWDVNLDLTNGDVTLQYFSNEACVESRKLRHSKDRWLIYEIGGACD